ncbi:MAG: hypothetical protein WBR35_09995 [Anaerolineae bacterium]
MTYPQFIYLGSNSGMNWLISAQIMPHDVLSTTHPGNYVIRFSPDKDRLLFKNEEGHIVPGQLALTPSDPQARIGTLFLEPRPIRNDSLGVTIISIAIVDSSQQSRFVGTIETDIENSQAFWWRRFGSKLVEGLSIPVGLMLALIGWVLESNHRSGEQREKERNERLNTIQRLIEDDPIRGVIEFSRFLSDSRYGGSLTEERKETYKRQVITTESNKRLIQRMNQHLSEGFSLESNDPFMDALKACEPAEESLLGDFRIVLTKDAEPTEVLGKARSIWKRHPNDAYEIVVQSLVRVGRKELETIGDWTSSERELFRDKRLKDINIESPAVYPDLILWVWQQGRELPLPPKECDWLKSHALLFHPFKLGIWSSEHLLKISWSSPLEWATILGNEPTVVCAADPDDRTAASVMASDILLGQRKSFVVFWRPIQLGNDPERILRDIQRAIGEEWLRLLAKYPGSLLQILDYEQVAVTEALVWITGSFQQLEARLRQNGLEHTDDSNALLRRLQKLSRPIVHGWTPGYERLLTWLLVRPASLENTFLVVDTANSMQAEALVPMMDILYDRYVVLKLFCNSSTIRLKHHGARVDLAWDNKALKSSLRDRISRASDQAFDEFGGLFGDRSLSDVDDILVEQAHGSLGRLLHLGNSVIDARVDRSNDPTEGLTREDFEKGIGSKKAEVPFS